MQKKYVVRLTDNERNILNNLLKKQRVLPPINFQVDFCVDSTLRQGIRWER